MGDGGTVAFRGCRSIRVAEAFQRPSRILQGAYAGLHPAEFGAAFANLSGVHLAGSVAGVGNPIERYRVGAKEFRDVVPGPAREFLQALEEVRHRVWVEARSLEDLHAHAVGLGLVGTGKVELLLQASGHAPGHDSGSQIRVDGGGENARQDSEAGGKVDVAPACEHARDMALRDMGDFMGDHGGQLGLVARLQYQPDMDAENAAGHRKGIDLVIVDREEVERPFGLRRMRQKLAAEGVNVEVDLGVGDQGGAAMDLAQQGSAEFALLCRAQDTARGLAQIRQGDTGRLGRR